MRSRAIAVLAAAVLLGVPAAFYLYLTSEQPRKLLVGHLGLVAHLPLYVAIKNGHFADNDIEVKLIKYNKTDLILDALVTRQIDVAYEVSSDQVLAYAIRDPEAFQVYQINQSFLREPIDSILVKPGSEIDEILKLRKKKIGVFPGPTASAMLKQCLKKAADLDPSDYTLVPLTPLLQRDALVMGQVDALFTYEPTGSTLVVLGEAEELAQGLVEKHIINPWTGGMGLFPAWLVDGSRKTAQAFQRAIYSAADEIERDPKAALRLLEGTDYVVGFDPAAIKSIRMTKLARVDNGEFIDSVTRQIRVFADLGIIESPDVQLTWFRP